MTKKLYRSRRDHIVGGVCGGLAEYFDLDPSLVRIIWAIAFFAGGIGVLPYIIAWIVIPEEPESGEVITSGASTADMESRGDAGGGRGMDAEARTRLIGAILIGLGLFFFIENYIPWMRFNRLWPLVLIAAGAYILTRGRKG